MADSIKSWPTLFKKTSKGADQQWTIWVGGHSFSENEKAAVIVTEYGQVDGEIQSARVVVQHGKNIGKKNETSAVGQACREAEAKWLKQKDKGYSESRGGGSMELKPMLAHKYEDMKDKVIFPAYIQPKLDGIRAIAHKKDGVVTLWSRQGKEHKGLAHIKAALADIMKDGDLFDGELYVHGMKFQTLVSLVKKDQAESKTMEYHVYDMVSEKSFKERMQTAENKIKGANAHVSSAHIACIRVVSTFLVFSHAEVEEFHEAYLNEGYEGAILRTGDCQYKQGYRSRELLKVKAFMDDEFIIVDVVPGVGKEADKGTFICETGLGTRFNCRPKGRDELRATYLADRHKFVGKKLTVRFFSWTDSEPPVPRFPVGIAVRDYE